MRLSDRQPIIRIRNLHKWFGPLHVLKGIDLDVNVGEKICVIGPSGSGKSTLLRCINFLEEATSGMIWIDGEPMGVTAAAEGQRQSARAAARSGMRQAG